MQQLKDGKGADKIKKKSAKTWLWEFTKKVVAILLSLYIIHSITAYAVMLYSGDYSALSTLLTESNETFRVCIGGYLLKATIENKIKLRRPENSSSTL